MSVDGNFDSVRTAGLVLVLLSLLSFCLGLFIIITMLCLLLLGIGVMARGMRGVSLIEAVTGMIITTQSSILLVGVFDIALNASDNVGVVLFLPIGVFCGGFIMANMFLIVWAVKMVCLKRWGTILQAIVHQRRRQRQRHCRIRMDDNGMESDEHQLLVTFEVKAEASHQHQHHPCWSWKKFGYQRVFSPAPTTEANSVDHDHEGDLTLTEALLCGESNEDLDCQHQSHILDDGCPFRSRLVQEQEKSDDNAIPYSRQSIQIQKWLTVNESQYESSNNFVEVSVLPNWPQISVATDTLPSSCRAAFEVIAIACMSGVLVVGSVFCVFSISTRGILEDDDILWHVKASCIYVLVSFLPTLSLSFLFLYSENPAALLVLVALDLEI